MIEVKLRAVRVDVSSATPLLLLEEVTGQRVLPIYIGGPEAAAIAYALEFVQAPRPMTHDLLSTVIEELGAHVVAIEINDLVEGTFYATIHLLRNDEALEISARPSDAIALALRCGASMYVADEIMARTGKVMILESDEEDSAELVDETELVEQLREFLDHVSPEDFNS